MMKIKRNFLPFLILFSLLFSVQQLIAQGHDTLVNIVSKDPPPMISSGDSSQVQVGLSIAVLSFGLILSLAVLIFLYKIKKGFGNIAFKTFGIILILTASLFLVVAGYGMDQITPVIGLLGTIAGFIFGSNLSPNGTSSND